MYGLTAALTKSTLDLLDGGVIDVFAHWQPYALLAAGFVGFVLNQSAFQAGHLAASLPAMAVTDPVVGSLIGVTLFGESLGATGTIAITATVVAVVVMAVATVSLARSPLVTRRARGRGRARSGLKVEHRVGERPERSIPALRRAVGRPGLVERYDDQLREPDVDVVAESRAQSVRPDCDEVARVAARPKRGQALADRGGDVARACSTIAP